VSAVAGPAMVTEWGVLTTFSSGRTDLRPCSDEESAALRAEHWAEEPRTWREEVVSRQVTEWEPDPAYLFPVPGDRVKCGLRADLPKKERVHQFVSLGIDTRNCGPEGFLDREVLACARCGADKTRAVAV
jgi:hypothetical protein